MLYHIIIKTSNTAFILFFQLTRTGRLVTGLGLSHMILKFMKIQSFRYVNPGSVCNLLQLSLTLYFVLSLGNINAQFSTGNLRASVTLLSHPLGNLSKTKKKRLGRLADWQRCTSNAVVQNGVCRWVCLRVQIYGRLQIVVCALFSPLRMCTFPSNNPLNAPANLKVDSNGPERENTYQIDRPKSPGKPFFFYVLYALWPANFFQHFLALHIITHRL